MPDPYEPHAATESAIRRLLFALRGGGVLGQLRTIPPALSVPIRQQNIGALLRHPWWLKAWEGFETGLSSRLISLSRSSSSALIRELSARGAAEISRRLADDFARNFANEIARGAAFKTEAGLRVAIEHVWERGKAGAVLRRELAGRLGPTAKQLEHIHRWELRRAAEGMERAEILAGIRRRAIRASQLRANVMASEALVRQVSESRIKVFSLAGMLVSSGNPLDKRTRPLHFDQTAVTRANPTPPGEAWAAGSPFAGPPPYEILCRCWIEGHGAPLQTSTERTEGAFLDRLEAARQATTG